MFAAVLLLLQAEAPAETVWRLAKDPVANRAEILKLGGAAVRPLLDMRTAALDPLLAELRLAGADAALRRDLGRAVPAGNAGGVTAKGLLSYYGFVDPGIPDALAAQVLDLPLDKGTRESHLRRICEKAALDYRVVRGRLVISTADRLWAWPAPAAVEPRLLRQAATDLANGAVEVRETAARRLIASGEAALPYLEGGDAETAAVAEKIRARCKPPVFAATLAVERQELDDAGQAILRLVRDAFAPIDFHGYEVPDALRILFEKSEVRWSVGRDVTQPVPVADVRGLPVLDALWWLTIPWGNDVALKEGRLVVETRANVEKLLRK